MAIRVFVLFRIFVLVFGLLVISSSIRAENQTTEIIPMQHRPADVLLKELRPLIDAEVKLTAVGNKLIARGPRGELAALKLLIEELDQPLAQFRISVRRDNASRQSSQGVAYHHDSDNVQISSSSQRSPSPQTVVKREGLTVSRTTKNSSSQVVVHRNSRLRDAQSLQEVRATEGYPAYIEIGQKVPVTQLLFSGVNHNLGVNQGSGVNHSPYIRRDYEPVVSGFYVIPKMVNDRDVLLELSTQKQSLQNHNRIDTERYGGNVRGRLNEWIYVGGVRKKDTSRVNASSRLRSSDLSQQGAIYLKVERLGN